MSKNINDIAHEIESALRETPEFDNLQKAFEQLKTDPKAYSTFRKFQKLQLELGQKQMQGQDLTEEDFGKMDKINSRMQSSALIGDLMTKDQALAAIINEVSSIITEPIQELYAE